MFTQNILFCLLCLPVVGALGILFFPKKAVRQMKLFALNVSLCNFLLSLNLWIFFDNSTQNFNLYNRWIGFLFSI